MQPVILAFSDTNERNIASRMGMPEYSYYFLLKWFAPVLATMGELKIIEDPEVEADVEYDRATQEGRACILFAFTPPHRTWVPKRCPVVPVIAWEFETIPDQAWHGDVRNDWRHVLARTGMAITTSEFARQAILRAMPSGYPVWSIPAPVWDRFARQGKRLHGDAGRTPAKGLDIRIKGAVFDSAQRIPASLVEAKEKVLRLKAEAEAAAAQAAAAAAAAAAEAERIRAEQAANPGKAKRERRAARRKRSLQKLMARLTGARLDVQPPLQEAAVAPPAPQEHHVLAKGIVYASILNPRDSRKNLWDMLSAFVYRFQNDANAILVLKLNENDSTSTFGGLESELSRFIWMKCRVVAFNGYLEDEDYDCFMSGIDYVVNASTGEGLCLPLMELMSMGTPAIAPDHTSMADYITRDNAFVLPSTRFIASWPHDPDFAYTTHAYKVPWDAILDAYDKSYAMACQQPLAYGAMSRAAVAQLEHHCSANAVRKVLMDVMQSVGVGAHSQAA